jgi:hypothetical protein
LETRQDEIDTKISQVLANTAFHTKALAELKSMLATYIGKEKDRGKGSPSMSKSVLENQVTLQIAPVTCHVLKESEVQVEHEVETKVQSSLELPKPLETNSGIRGAFPS